MNFANVKKSSITEGNVIKIERNGVKIWSRLPAGFQEVEYIQSDGACYINIGRVPNMDDIIEQKFRSLNTSNTTCSWFGSMPSSSSVRPRFGMGVYSQGFFVGVNNTTRAGQLDNNDHEIRWQQFINSYIRVTFDGEATTYGSAGGWDNPVALTSFLFARHGSNGVQTYDNRGTRIYYHREYLADETIQVHLIPCYRVSDNEIGMYDIVRNQFFTNQGSGSFTKGNDI